jgi:hypothetical protein
MQIRFVLTKKDQFEAFWSKKWDCQKMVIFFGLLFITFDPVNRFSSFKNHHTPNFKGFLLMYTLYTFSKVLVWDKTGFDL